MRRVLYFLCIIAVTCYASIKSYRYYEEYAYTESEQVTLVPPYNKFIDQKGDFRLHHGYEILQFIVTPISDSLNTLHTYLDEQKELQQYFTFVPKSTYHITIAKLLDGKKYSQDDFSKLVEEQEILDESDTYATVNGKQLMIIDKKEIRMEVELTSDTVLNIIKTIQIRWSEHFANLISKQHGAFYITIAYQYKDIPNTDTYDRLRNALENSQLFPITIDLGPIEICSYTNLITYTPILSDQDQ